MKDLKNKIILLLFLTFIFNCKYNDQKFVKIEINDKIYTFEVANSLEERKKGLMFRKKLNKDSGMLFVYPNELILSFYMKNTLIPLDIAFINSNFEVVDIQKMYPLDETPIISKETAQFALEVNRGFFERVGLKIGDKIKIITPLIYPKE